MEIFRRIEEGILVKRRDRMSREAKDGCSAATFIL